VPLSVSRLPKTIVSAIDEEKMLAIRAGTEEHRFLGIWAVVVEGRVFVRSWSLKPRSWYRTFREDPVGAIQVRGRTIRVRARFPAGERMLDAVSEAYLAKYDTPGSLKYARDLGRAKSRATTTELVPFGAGRAR
jgi:hypothetical protein